MPKMLSPTKVLVMGFFIIIMTGAILLKMPFFNNGPIAFSDALFTSTTASSVTGLTTVNISEQFNIYGQIIILLLIQVGGIGFMTLVTTFFMLIRKKISLNNKMLIKEYLNDDNAGEFKRVIADIVKYTLFIELIGAIFLFLRFGEFYEPAKAIYYSIFHSVSAFCNSGLDVLGGSSLQLFKSDWLVNLTLISLIILGGIGFFVWEDMIKTFGKKRFFYNLTTHSKLVIIITFALLAMGTIVFLASEFDNMDTIGGLDLKDKILASFFQSTTARTAGFESVNLEKATIVSKIFIMGLMIIGGSPTSTAGGIKTTTFGIMILLLLSILKNKEDVIIFNRRVTKGTIRRAIFIFFISVMIIFLSVLLLSVTETAEFEDILFEVCSAFSTTGLSTLTANLSEIGKAVIIGLMFIGRVGPVTMALSLTNRNMKKIPDSIKYPEGKILVG